MRSFSSTSHSLRCTLFFLVMVTASCSDSIVEKTCQKCGSDSPFLDVNFCMRSLEAVPVSRAANLQGLGVIAMELAMENTTSTVERIDALLNSSGGRFGPEAVACLEDCLELYSGAGKTLVFSIGAFLSGDYKIAEMWVSGVMEVATTCERKFGEKRDVSPLSLENRDLFQLSAIALCVTHKLAAPAPHVITTL